MIWDTEVVFESGHARGKRPASNTRKRHLGYSHRANWWARLRAQRRYVNRSGIRGVAQPGSAPALGAGGRPFKSARPDLICASSSGGQSSGLLSRGSGVRVPSGAPLSQRAVYDTAVSVAQLAEHRIVAPVVEGSNPFTHPTPRAPAPSASRRRWAVSSVGRAADS